MTHSDRFLQSAVEPRSATRNHKTKIYTTLLGSLGAKCGIFSFSLGTSKKLLLSSVGNGNEMRERKQRAKLNIIRGHNKNMLRLRVEENGMVEVS